jgi:hypothetical protein
VSPFLSVHVSRTLMEGPVGRQEHTLRSSRSLLSIGAETGRIDCAASNEFVGMAGTIRGDLPLNRRSGLGRTRPNGAGLERS